MWFDKASIISTSDISMRIVGTICPSKWNLVMRYYIEITNKANSALYIDKASSFRINDSGMAKSFYDNKIINISHGSSSGIGIGLGSVTNALGIGGIIGNLAGGISVGGGTNNNTSTTYQDERIIIIPPGGKSYISEHKYIDKQLISDGESYMIDVKQLQLYDGELREYDETSSPYKVNYIISFSLDPSFNRYSTLKAGLYAKYILCKSVEMSGMNGIPDYPESFQNQKQVFKTYNRAIPNFENMFGKIIVGRNYRKDQ